MANQTIEGCVDWTSGQVIFDGEACDGGDYTGCINWTGAHAGMVAVVVDEDNCDATYYGCVDWTTGKFELIIPDDCCSGDYTLGYDCDLCETDLWADGQTPEYVKMTISGITECPDTTICTGTNCADMNNTFYLKQTSACTWIFTSIPSENTVQWTIYNGNGFVYGKHWVGIFVESLCFWSGDFAQCDTTGDSTMGDVGDYQCDDYVGQFYHACGTGGTITVDWGSGIGADEYDAQF